MFLRYDLFFSCLPGSSGPRSPYYQAVDNRYYKWRNPIAYANNPRSSHYGRRTRDTSKSDDKLRRWVDQTTEEMMPEEEDNKKPHSPSGCTQPHPSGGGLTDITVNSQTIKITFWDHGTEDGDIIDIIVNGKVLRSGIVLTKAPQSFTVNLNPGKNVFRVRAVNEGSISPNTATVNFSNVTQGKDVQVYEIKSNQKTDMNITVSQ